MSLVRHAYSVRLKLSTQYQDEDQLLNDGIQLLRPILKLFHLQESSPVLDKTQENLKRVLAENFFPVNLTHV